MQSETVIGAESIMYNSHHATAGFYILSARFRGPSGCIQRKLTWLGEALHDDSISQTVGTDLQQQSAHHSNYKSLPKDKKIRRSSGQVLGTGQFGTRRTPTGSVYVVTGFLWPWACVVTFDGDHRITIDCPLDTVVIQYVLPVATWMRCKRLSLRLGVRDVYFTSYPIGTTSAYITSNNKFR